MEKQYEIFADDAKWEFIQFRANPTLKRDMHIYAKQADMSLSVILRMVCSRLLNNKRTFPGYQGDPSEEIRSAVDDIKEMSPVISRQLRINPRRY